MGNCQAVDAAALVIQHPCGKLERMYWPIAAADVMKNNPGHYVSLIIPLSDAAAGGVREENLDDNRTVRFTRVKLLRPTDTLVLGRAYRLVTSQEVMKVVRAKKHAKMRKNVSETSSEKQSTTSSGSERDDQVTRSERNLRRSGSGSRSNSKSWRPSLQSISESGKSDK